MRILCIIRANLDIAQRGSAARSIHSSENGRRRESLPSGIMVPCAASEVSIFLRAWPLPSSLCCNAARPARFLLLHGSRTQDRLMGATEGSEMTNGMQIDRIQGEHRA